MIVQRMRKTKQTSLHLEKLGPFFIGKVIWQSENENNNDQELKIKDRRSELANL